MIKNYDMLFCNMSYNVCYYLVKFKHNVSLLDGQTKNINCVHNDRVD
jgi:hypothetical protein